MRYGNTKDIGGSTAPATWRSRESAAKSCTEVYGVLFNAACNPYGVPFPLNGVTERQMQAYLANILIFVGLSQDHIYCIIKEVVFMLTFFKIRLSGQFWEHLRGQSLNVPQFVIQMLVSIIWNRCDSADLIELIKFFF